MTDLLERICGYLNGFEGKLCDFLPETFGSSNPQASAALLSEVHTRRYVDGSCCADIPFEIRLRINGVSIRGKLDAVKFFGELAEYMKKNPMKEEADGGKIIGISPNGGCTKSAVLQNGDEEYRMQFYIQVIMAAEA